MQVIVYRLKGMSVKENDWKKKKKQKRHVCGREQNTGVILKYAEETICKLKKKKNNSCFNLFAGT